MPFSWPAGSGFPATLSACSVLLSQLTQRKLKKGNLAVFTTSDFLFLFLSVNWLAVNTGLKQFVHTCYLNSFQKLKTA